MEFPVALQQIAEMLQGLDDPQTRVFPPTELYSEGWMLRLLHWFAMRGTDCLPVRPAEASRWYSEARLDSPFLKRSGSASNHLAEGQTHADGVVGHFTFREDTEAGLRVLPSARQLVVLEAKMFSRLSRGTTHAPSYDQAARNVASLAWTLHRAGVHARDLDSVGFFVLAPREHLERESSFRDWVSRQSVVEKVEARVADYKCDPDRHNELKRWLEEGFHPLLEVLRLDCAAWEDLLDQIPDNDAEVHSALHAFYERCLRYNRRAAASAFRSPDIV